METKARFALRGDLMIPDIHYGPKKCSAPMAEKSSVCLIIFIAEYRQWSFEHMDMKSAYIHTLFKYMQIVLYASRHEKMVLKNMGKPLVALLEIYRARNLEVTIFWKSCSISYTNVALRILPGTNF